MRDTESHARLTTVEIQQLPEELYAQSILQYITTGWDLSLVILHSICPGSSLSGRVPDDY